MKSPIKKIPAAVSAYLAKNGAKGGKTKGPTKARDPEKMSAAANKRWAKHNRDAGIATKQGQRLYEVLKGNQNLEKKRKEKRA